MQTGRIESYQVGDVAPMVGGDGQTRLTLEHEDPQHKFDLFCTPRVGGTRTQLSDASVAESSVRMDDGHVVWSTYPDGDEPYRVWTAEGCAGEPQQLEVSGLVRAVSWPDVYLSVPDDPWLVRSTPPPASAPTTRCRKGSRSATCPVRSPRRSPSTSALPGRSSRGRSTAASS